MTAKLSPEHPVDAFGAWAVFKRLMREDPEYAWAWHCNLAVPIMDAAEVSHERANIAAAYLMLHLFEYDITQHPHSQYGKSPAQEYFELRVAAERAEDAATSVGNGGR